MNRDQKAAVIDRVAGEMREAEAILAVDYRGLSVKQAMELRNSLTDAGASFQVVKNTLSERAADAAGAESLKELLEGPTAFAFVRGDVALVAKAIATFRRTEGLPEFKGGQMNGEPLTAEQIDAIARMPPRDVLQGQFVGVLASPLTTLVRGLGSMISGLAVALGQIQEQGLVSGDPTEPAAEEPAAEEPAADGAEPAAEAADATAADDAPAADEPAAEDAPAAEQPAAEADAGGGDAEEPSEAPGDPAAEAEAAEAETTSDAPSEGAETESQEG